MLVSMKYVSKYASKSASKVRIEYLMFDSQDKKIQAHWLPDILRWHTYLHTYITFLAYWHTKTFFLPTIKSYFSGILTDIL